MWDGDVDGSDGPGGPVTMTTNPLKPPLPLPLPRPTPRPPSRWQGYAVLYGCADRESRVLVLSGRAVAALFEHAAL